LKGRLVSASIRAFCLTWICLLANLSLSQTPQSRSTISMNVDATKAPQKILQARLHIPAAPGPLTLLYPKWIPGEHSPDGPIADVAGLRFTAGGKVLAWKRDPYDMFAFHIEVPEGDDAVEVFMEYLSPAVADGFSAGSSTTARLAVINWNQLLLYPKGSKALDLTFRTSLKLPAGWRFGTALQVRNTSEQGVEFTPVSLEKLIDSPVIAGAYFRTVELSPEQATRHVIEMAADSAAALEISDVQLRDYEMLVREALALFGARHYDRYHFLLALSNHVARFGLEHHESSDNRTWERVFSDENLMRLFADLLPHEFVHSWNGKYRRPAGMVSTNYQEPQDTEFLWVYEGLTQYLGSILATRSGLWSPDDYRQNLAILSSRLDLQSGRRWRPLADTATSAQLLYSAREDGADLRRGVDFYEEGALIWLEVDAIIRQRSENRKSLEDFCRLFFGPPDTTVTVKPYKFEELIAALNSTIPYPWEEFFQQRVIEVTPRAPLEGIEDSGWQLVYVENIPSMLSALEQTQRMSYFTASIGITVRDDGIIADVNPQGPAGSAGIGPGMKVVTVNGLPYSAQILREALHDGKTSMRSLELGAENAGTAVTFHIDYHGGERYPRLERDKTKPDLLNKILSPLTVNLSIPHSGSFNQGR